MGSRAGVNRRNARASVLQAYDNRQEKQVIQGLTQTVLLAYTFNKNGG